MNDGKRSKTSQIAHYCHMKVIIKQEFISVWKLPRTHFAKIDKLHLSTM